MPLPYNGGLISRAQQLRKDATRQERRLWYDFLRTYPIRFQRQKVIDGYIADFYCFQAKLVVELDGSQHYEDSQAEYDRLRTEALEAHGLKVLRFANCDVDRNFSGVCTAINLAVKEQT